MDMPTTCDCGEVFDLNDGHRMTRYGKETTVCEKCYRDPGDLSENEIKCLTALATYSDTWGERCIPFSTIEHDEKISRKEVAKACKSLKEKGLAEFVRGLLDDDGKAAGSGYHITAEGEELANRLEL